MSADDIERDVRVRVGDMVYKRRLSMKWSSYQVAEMLDIDVSVLSAVELGKADVQSMDFEKVLELLAGGIDTYNKMLRTARATAVTASLPSTGNVVVLDHHRK